MKLERQDYKNEMVEQGRSLEDKYEVMKASAYVLAIFGLMIFGLILFGGQA
jgi:hypothetical protein